jgi:transposase
MMKGGCTLTFRYCSPEEEQKIIQMYRSGQYSYQQIADMMHLSKGTIINIVKGYPYSQNKSNYYARLQLESAERLEQEIEEAKERARKAYERGNVSAYGIHARQWLMLLELLPDKDMIYDRLRDERLACEQKAWEGLSKGDYGEFGFYAETWLVLTDIIGDNAKNPWGTLTSNAKSKSRSIRFEKIDREVRKIGFLLMGNKSFMEITDDTWELIKPLLNTSTTGRWPNDRKTMNGILYALINCRSFRSVPSVYGTSRNITRRFAEWYRADVFSGLLALVPACPELEPAKQALLQIEKHRLMYGDSVPRLCDIQRGVEYEMAAIDNI